MNLNQLRAFAHLSHTLHYQRTAEELGVSQPSLSRTIRALEDELSVPLFERRGRNVVLTKYGSVFARHITQAMREVETGERCVRELADPSRMNIMISVSYYLSVGYLPALTRRYLDRHAVERYFFQFSQGNTPQVLEEVRGGVSEIGFCAYLEDQADIQFQPILRRPLCAVVPPGHPLAQKASTTLAEVSRYPMILSTDKTHFTEDLFRGKGLSLNVVLRMGEDYAIANLVGQRFGVSVLPQNEQLAACGVHLLPLEDREAFRTFYLVTSRNRVLSPQAEAFCSFALEESGKVAEAL